MPVIGKIESVGETDEGYGTLVDITTTMIRIGNIIADRKSTGESIVFTRNKYVDWTSKMSKLDATFACVVERLKHL